jgi:hypothetical protein
VTGGEEQYYWKRIGEIPKNQGVLARAMLEPMVVGNTFLHLCGKTGTQEVDNMVRQYGADTFMKVCEVTKKEIKSVRLYP